MKKGEKRIKYREGDWFGVPLKSGGWGIGLITRKDRQGHMLAFFFGPPRNELPKDTSTLELLHHSQAAYRANIGVGALQRGQWPVVGHHTHWRRELFPSPWFGFIDKAGKHASRTFFPDDKFVPPIDAKCSVEEAMVLPAIMLLDAPRNAVVFEEILIGRRRQLADPRQGTLWWTDQFPPLASLDIPMDQWNPEPPPYRMPILTKEVAIGGHVAPHNIGAEHVLTHKLSFETRAAALAAKKELKVRKYHSDAVHRSDIETRPWAVAPARFVTPTSDTIDMDEDAIKAIAKQFGGVHDGSEAVRWFENNEE